uniref:Uncharacterized protein n=1 Tax=Anguilla anguilla TaxID=7936 RepID=A0A0E9PNS4_ANGAN
MLIVGFNVSCLSYLAFLVFSELVKMFHPFITGMAQAATGCKGKTSPITTHESLRWPILHHGCTKRASPFRISRPPLSKPSNLI